MRRIRGGTSALACPFSHSGRPPPRVVFADAAYGTKAAFRAALTELGLGYVLSVRFDVTAHSIDAVPEAPARKGCNGCWPQPRYCQAPLSVAAHAAGLGRDAFTEVTWRQGSRGPMRSRFAALRVRPAGNSIIRPLRSRASAEQGWWDGILPDLWLLAERPAKAEEPTEYWFSNLPADTLLQDLVGRAKLRWRVEHDHRELKHGLGLDHFEGRSWPGWHHHVTLVSAAHAFLTEQRLSPTAPGRPHSLPSPRPPPGHTEVLDGYLHHLPPATSLPPAQSNKIALRPNGVLLGLSHKRSSGWSGRARPRADGLTWAVSCGPCLTRDARHRASRRIRKRRPG